MKIYGRDFLGSIRQEQGYLFKLVANEDAVYFFPYTTEHRDAKQPSLSYEDDSNGNALAAMIKRGSIEFRFHHAFSDERVRNLAQQILALPEVAFAAQFQVTYQGRTLISGNQGE